MGHTLRDELPLDTLAVMLRFLAEENHIVKGIVNDAFDGDYRNAFVKWPNASRESLHYHMGIFEVRPHVFIMR